jgi:hypothetical protein
LILGIYLPPNESCKSTTPLQTSNNHRKTGRRRSYKDSDQISLDGSAKEVVLHSVDEVTDRIAATFASYRSYHNKSVGEVETCVSRLPYLRFIIINCTPTHPNPNIYPNIYPNIHPNIHPNIYPNIYPNPNIYLKHNRCHSISPDTTTTTAADESSQPPQHDCELNVQRRKHVVFPSSGSLSQSSSLSRFRSLALTPCLFSPSRSLPLLRDLSLPLSPSLFLCARALSPSPRLALAFSVTITWIYF